MSGIYQILVGPSFILGVVLSIIWYFRAPKGSSIQGKIMRFLKSDEAESIISQTKGGSTRDYWGL